MQHAPPVLDEREVMTTARRLIIGAIDRDPGVVTEQQGADGAVADKEHVARAIPGQHEFDLADDT